MLGSYVDYDDPAINSTLVNKRRANNARIEVTAAAATVIRPI